MIYYIDAMDLCFKKDYKHAIPLFIKALDDTDNLEYVKYAVYNVAVSFMNLEDYTQAISFLTMYLKRWTGDSMLYFNLAYCYTCLDDNKKALLNYNAAWVNNVNDNKCKGVIDFLLSKLDK